MKPQTEKILEKTILFVPLMLALAWMANTVINTQQATAELKLSPTRLDGLVNALFIFIVIYSIILMVLFFKMNRELKRTIEERKIHDVPKKEIVAATPKSDEAIKKAAPSKTRKKAKKSKK